RTPYSSELSRNLGSLHLDRSFEQNRICLNPGQRREPVSSAQANTLERIANPLPVIKPDEAALYQVAGQDLAAKLRLRYPTQVSGPPPFHKVVLPLWATQGPGRINAITDEKGGHLTVTWEDPR